MSETQSEKKQEVMGPDIEGDATTEKQIKQIVLEVAREFSGPIPPPEIIKEYEAVLPGSADRIIKMAESEQEYRHNLRHQQVKFESRDSLFGIISGFLLCVGTILAAVFFVYKSPSSAAVIMGSLLGMSGPGAVIVTIIKSTRAGNRSKEKDDN